MVDFCRINIYFAVWAIIIFYCTGLFGAQVGIPQRLPAKTVAVSDYELGVSAMDKGEYTEAVKLFNQSLKNNEKQALSHYRLANIYRFVFADEAKSEFHLNKYIAYLRDHYNENNFSDFENEGFSDSTSKNHIEAIESFQQAMHDASMGKYESAREKMEKAVLMFPFDPVMYYNLAVINHKLNRLPDSIFCYQKSLAIDTANEPALIGLAMAFQQKGDDISAIDYYKKVMQINPKNISALNNLAILLEKIDMIDDAMVHYKKIIEIDPNYVRAYNNIGTIYARKKEYRQAQSYLRKAIEIDQSYLAPHYNLGLIYEEHKDYKSALNEYRLIFLNDSEYPQLAEKIAVLEKQLAGQTDTQVITALKQPVSDRRNIIQPVLNDKLVCEKTNSGKSTYPQTAKNIQILREELSALQKNVYTQKDIETRYIGLALRFKSANDCEGAIKCLESGLKRKPSSLKMRYLNASMLKEKKYFFKAIKEYEGIIKIAPEETDAHRQLSLIYADKQNPLRDSKKALSYYKEYKALKEKKNTGLKIKDNLNGNKLKTEFETYSNKKE